MKSAPLGYLVISGSTAASFPAARFIRHHAEWIARALWQSTRRSAQQAACKINALIQREISQDVLMKRSSSMIHDDQAMLFFDRLVACNMAAPDNSRPEPSQWRLFFLNLGKRLSYIGIEFIGTFAAIAGIAIVDLLVRWWGIARLSVESSGSRVTHFTTPFSV